jgi:hypothetical protein
MGSDLIAPKPTKEFHEAYKEIYGKKKRDNLDLPPQKFTLQQMDTPPAKEQKRGFFSNLFKRKETVDEMDAPPPKVEEANQDESFGIEEPIKLDKRPEKKETKKPVWNKSKIEEITLGLGVPNKKATKKKVKKKIKQSNTEQKRVHDFLAEIKFGGKTVEEEPIVASEEMMPAVNFLGKEEDLPDEIPTLGEQTIGKNKTLFEKAKMELGARDMAQAYEKHKSVHDSDSPEKENILTKDEGDIVPMQSKTLNDKSIKKIHTEAKSELKKQKVHLAKLRKQEKRIDEKSAKMEALEKSLKEKQKEIESYGPRLDALQKAQHDLKIKEHDIKIMDKKLAEEQNAIIKSVKRLEEDQKLLQKEEDAIIKAMNKLQKEREKLTSKASEFKEIMKKVNVAEKAMKRKSEALEEREQRIAKKEKLIKQEVERVNKLKKTATKLKDVEETYERMKKRLREAYKQHSYTYAQKASLKEPAMKTVPLEPTFQFKHKERTKEAMSGDITNMLTATKQLILEKHYDDANTGLNTLMTKYMQIPDNNPRKKEIYYEILGLKNMLKLELLE